MRWSSSALPLREACVTDLWLMSELGRSGGALLCVRVLQPLQIQDNRFFNTYQRAVESRQPCLGSFPFDLCYTSNSRIICFTCILCFGSTELLHQAQGFTPASFLNPMMLIVLPIYIHNGTMALSLSLYGENKGALVIVGQMIYL